MYSFEGEHRKRPNVSLSGASKLMDKNAFLDKLKKERQAREKSKKEEQAAICIQAFIRGCLCRLRTNNDCRDAYDSLMSSASATFTQEEAKALCLRMLQMYRFKHDAVRLMSLCSQLVRHNSSLLLWTRDNPHIWTHILSQLLCSALDALCPPINAKGSSPRTDAAGPDPAGLSHAGPLRLLEVVTQPQSWASLPGPSSIAIAGHIFAILTPLIKKGYFRLLVSLLVAKVPPVDERGGECRSPLAQSLYSLLLFPLYLVANCSRGQPSERATPHGDWSWVATSPIGGSQSTNEDQSSCTETSTSTTQISSSSPMEEASGEFISQPTKPLTLTADFPLETSNNLLKRDAYNQEPVASCKPVKFPREEVQSIGLGGSSDKNDSSTRSKSSSTDSRNSRLLCYGFNGAPAVVPENFVNLTLYSLTEELFTQSEHSQVHHWLVPALANSRLLLRRPSDTHALIQAVHFVLTGSLKGFDPHAPFKLAALLTLVPIKTSLSTSSLHLYLCSCRALTLRTTHHLPSAPVSSLDDEGEDSSSEEEEDDDMEEEDMDVEDLSSALLGTINRKEKLTESAVQLGSWCLAHINSPAYVSWVLEQVEAGNTVDREVLTEFCGLTHTLLTAPCLSLFQCRLLYGVVGRHRLHRAMWELLTSLYPSWRGSHTARSRGVCRLLETVCRGSPLEPRDRDSLVPVLTSFVTALHAVLATLHDNELVTDKLAGILQQGMMMQGGDGDSSRESTSASDGGKEEENSPVLHFAFGASELVTISATLKDVCVGLAELAHPDARSSTMVDISYKEMWDHCFKSCVDVVRQLHLRDTRLQFCPSKHWLTERISLPEIPRTDSYRNLLNTRSASRRQAFMPARWRSRAQLMSDGKQAQLSMFEKVRATVLQELPFVFSFKDRAEVFLRLVQEDRAIAHGQSDFNVGPNINIRVRRTHLYEDSFEKLSADNEANMRLCLRVQLLNEAGAVEPGVDGGGLFREFLSKLLLTAFDPNRGFFLITNENTLYPNPSAHLLHPNFQDHYFFIGRMLGKALYEKLLVEIPLAGFFLSKLLSRKGFSVEFHHLDSLDPELCRNLLYLKRHKGDVQDLGLDFTVLRSDLGHNTVVELVPDGANIPVTADNKIEYIYRMADYKLNKQITKQCYAFRKGLYDVVPAEWLQLFDWRELQTMISGSISPVSIDDLKANTKYAGEYNSKHKTIKLFWQVIEQFDDQQRSQLLKFVTSCSRPPLLGFKDLHPPFCIQPSGSETRLPSAATCMNLLKLPEYSDPITLREKLLYSITSNAGFELS